MKKGVIGAYQLGCLKGITDSINFVDRAIGARDTDVETIFYATAIQAGVDEYVLPRIPTIPPPKSNLVSNRIRHLARRKVMANVETVLSAFSPQFPHVWGTGDRERKHPDVDTVVWFLVDLLDAMSTGASVLTLSGLPDMKALSTILAPELYAPIANLFSVISDVAVSSPVPQKVVSTEDLRRFDSVLSGISFRNYVSAQSTLDDARCSTELSIPLIEKTGHLLVDRNKQLITTSKTAVRILELTPKIVDAVFGKLPGSLAELAARLGLEILEARRRVVIYDLSDTLWDLFRIQRKRLEGIHAD